MCPGLGERIHCPAERLGPIEQVGPVLIHTGRAHDDVLVHESDAEGGGIQGTGGAGDDRHAELPSDAAATVHHHAGAGKRAAGPPPLPPIDGGHPMTVRGDNPIAMKPAIVWRARGYAGATSQPTKGPSVSRSNAAMRWASWK